MRCATKCGSCSSLFSLWSQIVFMQGSAQAGSAAEEGRDRMAHVEDWPMCRKIALMNRVSRLYGTDEQGGFLVFILRSEHLVQPQVSLTYCAAPHIKSTAQYVLTLFLLAKSLSHHCAPMTSTGHLLRPRALAQRNTPSRWLAK